MAEILDEHIGIPCSETDVNNAAKKKVFKPHQVPNTNPVRIKLAMLKKNLFPFLVVKDFLSNSADFFLIVPSRMIT
jgi:hypothetical protein